MFDWLKKLFKKKNKKDTDFDWDFDDQAFTDREKVDFSDAAQAEAFVRNCCEQMREATMEIEDSSAEFNAVTERLRDIEEIESLPGDVYRLVAELAKTLVDSQRERESYMNRRDIMPDDQYRRIERHESDFPRAIEDFKKNEDYKMLVKRDLKNLEGEKMSDRFRISELKGRQETLKTFVHIVIVTVFFTVFLLVFLQFKFSMSVSIGYLLCVAAGAVALTAAFISYGRVDRERKSATRHLNHAIVLQNRVKIRYVNVTGLIEYACSKYGVNSSEELTYLWERYLREKKQRERFARVDERADESGKRLVEILAQNRVKQASVWLRQAAAIIDRREMVEIRHELVARRGSLRKRIAYNEETRDEIKEEVKDITLRYPSLAPMVMDVLDEFG